jgi:N-acetylmuramic acid 6-phosphate etherase
VTNQPVFLGLECGGTRTVALATDAALHPLARVEAGPANLRLVTDARLVAHFRALRTRLPAPSAIGVGMAGARDAADCARVQRALEKVWPGVPHRVTHDLESALAAAELDAKGNAPAARIIVLSGTGSCCYGRNAAGQTAKVGGWGHQLGDRGSGYEIAFRALRSAVHSLDHTGRWGRFGQRALRALLLNEPNDLIAWLQTASKTEIAALAPEVFAAAREADAVARNVLAETVASLAADALACAQRLATRRDPVGFTLAGSVLLRQPAFARALARRIRAGRAPSTVAPLGRDSVWGAVVLAKAAAQFEMSASASTPSSQRKPAGRTDNLIPASSELSPTERRNPRSENFDRLPLDEALELMWSEEEKIPAALRTQRLQVANLARLVVRSFRYGGRLFYFGAGTSGRLGVLDASECPPTFRTPPELVQGVIAGGAKALHSAVEGAEDDLAAGARAVEFRGVGSRDIVVGIAASGRTPFVWGALSGARRRGAATALVCFNPHLAFARGHRPDVVIAPDLGPEALTGSTRLKAGTATKLILNAVTTLAMVRMGKVVGNLMVDLNPSNTKLRDRATRIVAELTGATYPTAWAALEAHDWVVSTTLRAMRKATRGKS